MFQNYLADNVCLVEKHLDYIISSTGCTADLSEAMKYSLMAGGKRLRPIMLMAVVDAFGGEGRKYLNTACALEFIHTYSLIHDDLPAMDDDDLRRGKPTCHKVFGEAIAILAGDALLTHAFSLIMQQTDASDSIKVRIAEEFSQAAGMLGMVGGQVMDIQHTKNYNSFSETELVKMHSMKTGALFCAAIRAGALLSRASEEEIVMLTNYANAFGLIFQITDDILDAVGEESVLGKPIGSDEKNDKATYLKFFTVSEAQIKAEETAKTALANIEFLGERAAFLRYLLKSLLERKK